MGKLPRALTLTLLREKYAVLKFAPDAPVPGWASEGDFFSLTRTPGELSILTRMANVPESLRVSEEWSMFKVHGPFAFTEVGVLASLAGPLADAQIGIFVISTFDTDFLFVKAEETLSAMQVLEDAGHRVLPNDLV